jgi:hypothetical protein
MQNPNTSLINLQNLVETINERNIVNIPNYIREELKYEDMKLRIVPQIQNTKRFDQSVPISRQ